MTEEEKRRQEVPEQHRRSFAREVLLIVITAIIMTLFTGGIAYSVQSMIGGGESGAVEGVLVDGVREFRIQASQWYFDPAIIRVTRGDTVRFIVTSPDIMHGFAINELGINLPLSPNIEAVQEVVIPPDIPKGTYSMYCSIFCGIGHPYMKGSAICCSGYPMEGSVIIGEGGFKMEKILPYFATSVMAGVFAAFVIVGRRRVI